MPMCVSVYMRICVCVYDCELNKPKSSLNVVTSIDFDSLLVSHIACH